jgi:hypothetical protein
MFNASNFARGALVAVAGLGAQMALADSISPTSYAATIGVGATTTVNKTVTVTKEATTSKLDIFFLADTTGSMGSAIASVKAAAASLLTNSAALGDVQWAVGEYKDVGDVWTYKLNTAFTSIQANVNTGINAWGASGGGDWPEANLFALQSAANDSGWRAGAGKVLVMFGDAPGHDPRAGATEASAIAALQAKGIKVQAVDNGDLNSGGQAGRITAATGGGLFASSGAGVGAAIAAAITSAVSNYTKVCLDTSETPAGLSATSSACITGAFDRSIDRTFNFTLDFTGLSVGDYSFNTYGTVDGGRVATEADRITVTGSSVPEPGTLALIALAALAGSGLRSRRTA